MSADIASVTIDKLRNEIARLKGQTNWVCTCGGTDCEGQKDNAALKATLTAVSDANQRGIKAWQQAHPDKAMVWPDQAKLVEWLLRENAKLQAHAERVSEANDRLVVENDALRDSIDHAETLLCNSLPMAHCKQSDWDNVIRKWRDQKHAIDLARKEAQP